MSLCGVGIAFFLPAVLLLYWLLPRRAWLQNAVLLLASAVFYLTWDLRFLPLLGAAILIDWLLSHGMAHARESGRRKALLTLGIVLDLGCLATFKYAGFFASSLNELLMTFGLPDALPTLKLALPIGISYTTLIRIGYLLDVYYDRRAPEPSLLNFAVFVGFFAHLIAGPIVRARAMLPQYAKARRLTTSLLTSAALALLFGYALKAYVSEVAGGYAYRVFADPSLYGIRAHWLGLFAYAIQLFSDFAGYSLLAIGVGRLFGLQLPENFRTPYLSTGMLEFWRRWHITLNAWLFDYLFYPWTTGRSWMRGRIVAGFLAVFLISGLWHGAAWTFVLWGLLHGVALTVQHRWDRYYRGLCRKDRAWVQRRKSRAYKLTAWALTQLFFVMTLLPFRSPSLGFMLDYLQGMFAAPGVGAPAVGFRQLAPCLLVFLAWHLQDSRPGQWAVRAVPRLPAPVIGLLWAAAIVFLALFVPAGAGTFIYANF